MPELSSYILIQRKDREVAFCRAHVSLGIFSIREIGSESHDRDGLDGFGFSVRDEDDILGDQLSCVFTAGVEDAVRGGEDEIFSDEGSGTDRVAIEHEDFTDGAPREILGFHGSSSVGSNDCGVRGLRTQGDFEQ